MLRHENRTGTIRRVGCCNHVLVTIPLSPFASRIVAMLQTYCKCQKFVGNGLSLLIRCFYLKSDPIPHAPGILRCPWGSNRHLYVVPREHINGTNTLYFRAHSLSPNLHFKLPFIDKGVLIFCLPSYPSLPKVPLKSEGPSLSVVRPASIKLYGKWHLPTNFICCYYHLWRLIRGSIADTHHSIKVYICGIYCPVWSFLQVNHTQNT